MPYQYSQDVTLVTVECCNCGIVFAMPQSFSDQLKVSHANFYCPNGHPQHYAGKSEAEIARAAWEQEKREAARLRERAIVAERAQQKAEKAIAKHKKRAAAGLCTCCNRTVSQLAQHMKSKHPDFMALQGLAVRKQLPEKVQ
jgi:hypothetical protein